MLNLYSTKYTDASLFPVMLSLSYFNDAEVTPMPEMLIAVEWDEVKTTIREAIVLYDLPWRATDDGDYIGYNLAFYRHPPFSVRVYPEDED